jgi:hypothetical protein
MHAKRILAAFGVAVLLSAAPALSASSAAGRVATDPGYAKVSHACAETASLATSAQICVNGIVPEYDSWCKENCAAGFCPESHCKKCVKLLPKSPMQS